MNLLEYIERSGISLSYLSCEGKIRVKGLSCLLSVDSEKLQHLIKVNKQELIEVLKLACPYAPEDIEKFKLKYPDLICCPRRNWRWIYRTECKDCTGHARCKHKGKNIALPVTGELSQQPEESQSSLPDVGGTGPKGSHHSYKGRFRAWKTARPWLLAHLPELKAKGWTRTKLFRAGQLKYPVGPWGVAFSRNWLRPDVEVIIDPAGAIRWTWTEPTGREVSQASRPKP